MGERPCIIFVFGGAFIGGQRDNVIYNNYFNFLVEHNYVVASIDYRLGLKDVQKVSVFLRNNNKSTFSANLFPGRFLYVV